MVAQHFDLALFLYHQGVLLLLARCAALLYELSSCLVVLGGAILAPPYSNELIDTLFASVYHRAKCRDHGTCVAIMATVTSVARAKCQSLVQRH